MERSEFTELYWGDAVLSGTRISLMAIALALGNSGCNNGSFTVSEPPHSAKEAEKWWADTVDWMDLDQLEVLCEVSEIHKQNATTATLTHFSMGRTMVAMYSNEIRQPVPLPDTAMARAKSRLANRTTDRRQVVVGGRWEAGKDCSAERATEICKQAEQRHNSLISAK